MNIQHDCPGYGSEHEACSDHEDVKKGNVFEAEAVEKLERSIACKNPAKRK